VTQKTARLMLHRIRDALATRSFEKLSGTVEVDETFIGGQSKLVHAKARERRIHGRGGAVDKTAVQGAVQRGGIVKAEVIQGEAGGLRLEGNVRRWVEHGSAVYTDEARAYLGLDQFYAHKSVKHSREYVSGDVHTNTVENFWSLLKRALEGTQIHVDEVHLHRYVAERAFAHNHRDTTDLGRMRLATAGTPAREFWG
jgi:hypothetical protein